MDYTCQFKNGATVTVFVPYDCNNNCPFCVNKLDYKIKHKVKDVHAVIASMKKIDEITPRCDYVFTGGEPLADLDSLELMLNTIREMNASGSAHKVFINTTFPVFTEEEAETALAMVDRNTDLITGFNISRHLVHYVSECDDAVIDRIPVPVRINTVVFRRTEVGKLLPHLERFKKYPVQIREDYTICKEDNLNDYLNDEGILGEVIKVMGLEFDEKNFLFRNDFRWNYELQKEPQITLHRTMPYSTVIVDGKEEINDIIIEPGGHIRTDWNDYGHEMDLEKYKKCF